ncbi:MAG: hypothetical protein WCK29_01625 [archaeon]
MENKILELIAQDRLHIPMSSLDQKLKRAKNKEAKSIAAVLGKSRYAGERFYAFVESEDKEKARGMKEAFAEFAQEFPKYGLILAGKIAEKRTIAEEHLYFGVNPNCRLTADDYIGVMQSLGLSENTSRALYPDLMNVSRKLAKSRDEERSIIVGKYAEAD